MYIKLGGAKHPIAYCNLHKATLDFGQMTAKDCLAKKCHHLKKFDVPFWETRDKLKNRGKAKRAFARNEREDNEIMMSAENVKIDNTDYDALALKTRTENAPVKPITLLEWEKMPNADRENWLRRMNRKFPNISPRLYEKSFGLSAQRLNDIWKDAGLSKGAGARYFPKAEEMKAWNEFWGVQPNEQNITKAEIEEEKKVVAQTKGETASSAGIVEIPRGTKVIVPEMPKAGEVVFLGTMRGKAKDVLNAMTMLGLAEKEISVTIGQEA